MYVCVCNAVTDQQIREAYCDGCCSVRDLRRELGVGSCCGRCVKCARSVLRECHEEYGLLAPPLEETDPVLQPAVG